VVLGNGNDAAHGLQYTSGGEVGESALHRRDQIFQLQQRADRGFVKKLRRMGV
jgi:hypothetical protein